MRPLSSIVFLALLTVFAMTIRANAQATSQFYVSPNHQLRAVVENRLSENEIMSESVVSIYDSHDKLLVQKSYFSVDQEHGYCVVQLIWSEDSKFCVWSLTSSGGHSPWHYPTDSFIQKCNAIVNIDTQLNCGLSEPKFTIKAPHIFRSQRLIPNPTGEPKFAQVSFDLTKLNCG